MVGKATPVVKPKSRVSEKLKKSPLCTVGQRFPRIGQHIMLCLRSMRHSSVLFTVPEDTSGAVVYRGMHITWKTILSTSFGAPIPMTPATATVILLRPHVKDLMLDGANFRTQIVRPHDAASIIMRLGLKPGHRVIESGTGSASLTTAFAHAVYPDGHVFTFEFHADRAKKAKEALDVRLPAGVRRGVTCTHRDANDGFFIGNVSNVHANANASANPTKKVTQELPKEMSTGTNPTNEMSNVKDEHPVLSEKAPADALFLDLPCPWAVIPKTIPLLKQNARVCCYSPCMEQVMHTKKVMDALGMRDIVVLEVVPCTLMTRERQVAPPLFHNTSVAQECSLTPTTADFTTEERVEIQKRLKEERQRRSALDGLGWTLAARKARQERERKENENDQETVEKVGYVGFDESTGHTAYLVFGRLAARLV